MENQNKSSWLKAAVIGSIWASFEIIFGTFLHNLRIPFAGTFLTFFSLVLLIGFSYKWDDRYLFLKAGIITALMRSMLPTSIILGPLIGILTEAVIFQLTINLFGRTFLAFAIAGVLSMLSAIIHKVISILLMYGFDIVKILENIYFMLLKMTKIDLPVNQLFVLIGVIYVFLGIITAYIGTKLGKSILTASGNQKEIDFEIEAGDRLFQTTKFKYNSYLIAIHIFVLILSLFLVESYPYYITLLLVLPYLFFLFYRYGGSLRRLSKPVFWIQLLIILILAFIFWQDKYQGLIIGVKMITRAVLVVSVFTAISVELKNPVVKSLMYRKGFSGLYSTIGLASSAIPFLIKNIATSKNTYYNPVKVLKKAILLSDSLLENFTAYLQNKNKLTIISGKTRSGKTTFLKNIISLYKNNNPSLKIGGIIAHGVDKDGKRLGFIIENINSGEKKLLCNNIKEKNDIKLGKFYFKKEGLIFGHKALQNAIDNADLLVIDEIGPLELKGKGWFDEIELAMNTEGLDMIWVVRKSLLENVLKLWRHTNVEVIDVENM